MGGVPKHKIAATCRKWISDTEVVIVVCTIAICSTLAVCSVASFPVPRPAFRRLQYGKAGPLYRTASDEKLGVGLGTRLCAVCMQCNASQCVKASTDCIALRVQFYHA